VITVRLRIVDAFTERAFTGNPAAIVRLDDRRVLPDDDWFRALAFELNLPATGFILPAGEEEEADFRLRWFSPSVELELCGHATLASARCLFDDGVPGPIRFATRSGVLSVRQRSDGAVVLELPAQPPSQIDPPAGLARALGAEPVWVGEGGGKYLVELVDAAAVRHLQPDIDALLDLPTSAVVVTACSDLPDADFVSRCFAPALGNPEDPVTGSAHAVLGPFWGARLGRNELVGLQLSRRTGLVGVRLTEDRAELTGRAVVVLDGQLSPKVLT
jgi:PhzF family phenazine biosynthesis protein